MSGLAKRQKLAQWLASQTSRRSPTTFFRSVSRPASRPPIRPSLIQQSVATSQPLTRSVPRWRTRSSGPPGPRLTAALSSRHGHPQGEALARRARTARPGSNGMRSVGSLLASQSAPVCQHLRRRTPPRRRGSRPPGLLRAAPLPGEERAGARGQTGRA